MLCLSRLHFFNLFVLALQKILKLGILKLFMAMNILSCQQQLSNYACASTFLTDCLISFTSQDYANVVLRARIGGHHSLIDPNKW